MGSYKLTENVEYNRYYHSVIQLRRENTKKVVEKVMPIIENILKEANRQDPRFSAEPVRMGSYYQGLKIKRADEFDLNVPLQGLGNYVWGKGESARYGFDRAVDDQLQTYPDDICVVSKNVPLPDPPAGFSRIEKNYVGRMWQNSNLEKLDFGSHIIPFLVRRHYKSVVTAAIRKHGLQGTVMVSRRKHGPAVTLNIKLASLAHAVSVDLSPVVENHLSIHSSCGFPHPGARWPSPHVQKQMSEAGIGNTAHHDFEWRWSFVGPEQKMLDGMDADGGCRKKVLRILKGLAQDFWATSSKPALTSYHLKNLLFWECEKYPDPDYWRQDRLAERINGIISELRQVISKRHLTLFMNKNVNLLATCDHVTLMEEVRRIEDYLKNSSKKLQSKSG